MQSKLSQPTFRLIKETNKLVSDVKSNDVALTIHPFSRHLKWNDLAVIGNTNKVQGDGVDYSFTGGFAITMALYGPFIEGHMIDTALIGWSTDTLKRVGRSSLSGDIQQACNTDDEVFAARLL